MSDDGAHSSGSGPAAWNAPERSSGVSNPALGGGGCVTEYRVVIERDESGAWIARVPRVPGCHTYGRTLDQARRRIREALSLWVEDAACVKFEVEVRLPREIRRELQKSSSARRRAERERAEAAAATKSAANALVRELRVGMRDAAELLGISHQRVQQLVRSS